MRRFMHSELGQEGETTALGEEVAWHVRHVMRMRAGQAIVLFDGRGAEARAELVSVDPVTVRFLEPPRPSTPPEPVHLLLGILKGPAMDDAVRMATEAGATHIHPILCARTVATGDRGDRWARICVEAARQCGRADVPELGAPVRLPVAAARVSAIPDRRVAVPGATPRFGSASASAIVVGPEGGLSPDEISALLNQGFIAAGLGPWTLRAVTAAGIAVASVQRLHDVD